MNQGGQNPRILLRPWMVAILWLWFGAVLCLMILRIDLDSPEFQSLFLTVLYGGGPAVIFVVIIIILSPTPEWSSTAKRLCGIGFVMIFSAYSIAETFHNTLYGVTACVIGIIVLLISTSYPGAILGYTDTEQPERNLTEQK